MNLKYASSIRVVENWQSRFAFLLAAIGSAVGLGNIWRFPYVCYKHGGGAFLIPYFVALFSVGIPLLVAEYSTGTLFRRAAPMAMKGINRKVEWVGWWSVSVAFFIAIYYCVIMAWCLCYLFHSVNLVWKPDASLFFFDVFLDSTASPKTFGAFNVQIAFALLFIWTAIYLILYKGVRSIGRIVAITVPLPTLLLLLLAVRGMTLPGAGAGLDFYLDPDFSALASPQVWLAAYAQIFFSLSLAQGIMIAYARFLPKKSDVTNNAVITALADGGTAFLAGFAVFSALGYLAFQTGLPMTEIAREGIGLAFITYPTAIAQMPLAASLFGVVFFLALLTFGIDSAFSMVESVTNGIQDKFGVKRERSTLIVCLIGFSTGLLLVFGSGIHWVDIMDHVLSNFALVLIGLLECLSFAYLLGGERIRRYANERSELFLGRWYSVMLKLVAPVALISVAVASIVEILTEGYGGFPAWALAVGILIVLASIAVSFIAVRLPCQREHS
jgi:NSS family neurotransmitter:Na+ symporter